VTKNKLTINDIYMMKKQDRKVTWLTCYDFPTAQFAEAAGLDLLWSGIPWACVSMVIRAPCR
jgi:3-methyl-2-oxobutanoate hydroxymethyltransferase